MFFEAFAVPFGLRNRVWLARAGALDYFSAVEEVANLFQSRAAPCQRGPLALGGCLTTAIKPSLQIADAITNPVC
jgi:hypothetical protein